MVVNDTKSKQNMKNKNLLSTEKNNSFIEFLFYTQ